MIDLNLYELKKRCDNNFHSSRKNEWHFAVALFE